MHIASVIITTLAGAFLRFFRLAEFVTFLGDQGRDTVVIKRIATFEHFPALGPITSIGNLYLGPFYYYFMAPWLALWRLDPIGPAIGVAFISSFFSLITYFTVKDLIDKKTALIASIFVAFSATLVDFSRFSWNPNLLPLFSLLTAYFLIKATKTPKWYFYALTGAFFSLSIQLHYLALFLILPIGILMLKHWNLRGTIYSFLSFILFTSPLILFDLKNNFLNSKNFLALLQNPQSTSGNKFEAFFNSFNSLNKFSFAADFPIWISLIVILAIAYSYFKLRTGGISAILLFFLLTLLGVSFYGGPKYPHYFGAVYPFYYIVVAFFLAQLTKPVWGKTIIGAFLIGFIWLNGQNYYFLYGQGSYQIERAKKVSKLIYDNIKVKEYTLTALPEVYSDHTARYFLELWGKRPIERGETKKTNELFVICETTCEPMGAPIWDVANFAPTKIAGQWEFENIKVYKLTR